MRIKIRAMIGLLVTSKPIKGQVISDSIIMPSSKNCNHLWNSPNFSSKPEPVIKLRKLPTSLLTRTDALFLARF